MSNKRELFDAAEVILDLAKTFVSWKNKRKKKQKGKAAKKSK
jgi:hypothetical protein